MDSEVIRLLLEHKYRQGLELVLTDEERARFAQIDSSDITSPLMRLHQGDPISLLSLDENGTIHYRGPIGERSETLGNLGYHQVDGVYVRKYTPSIVPPALEAV